jgi:mono/diheme cytochrome c family protein
VAGLNSEGYLTQALLSPAGYVVEGYPPIMPPADKPPADLTQTELKAVIAFLQSMGGEVTSRVTSEDLEAAKARPASTGGVSPAVAYLELNGCTTCHDVKGEARQIGPPLTTVAERLSEEEIRQSILDPDAVVSAGYAPGLMPKTLAEDLTKEQVNMLVEHIVSLSGPGAGTNRWARLVRLTSHPMLQLIALIFVFNAGAWVAVELLEKK